MSPRGPFVKALVAILLCMGASLGVFLAFLAMNGASAETIRPRPMQALSYLPQIVEEPDDLVMVFGSSMTDAGFNWYIPLGEAKIKYTATIDGDSWHEVGDFVRPDGQSFRIFEMNLKRIGDTDWPAAGAVGLAR